MTRVAVALFVKNEFSDITGWLAWHFAIGVDTVFVYDDHSTDGTWEILQAASKFLDIKLYRTNPELQSNFYWRQRDSYLDAAKKALDQNYDWIAFLDGDEYIYIDLFDDVHPFLAQFPDAEGVALNWCIYGSGGKVVRPKTSTPEAFVWRANETLNDAVLVKSFIRPQYLREPYQNPHRFSVDDEKYVDANGMKVNWEGATKKINWSGARVLHYICRSMEHYVERIRRRLNADMSNSTVYWDHFNRNDVEDFSAHKFLPKVNAIISKINYQSVSYAIKKLRERSVDLELPIHNERRRKFKQNSRTNVYKIRSYHGYPIYINHETCNVVQIKSEMVAGLNYSRLYCVIREDFPGIVELRGGLSVSIAEHMRLNIESDDRNFPILIYKFSTLENISVFEKKILLKNPINDLFLAALPMENEAVEKRIESNRHQASEWEWFFIEPISFSDENSIIVQEKSRKLSAADIVHWVGRDEELPNVEEFLSALAELPKEEIIKLSSFVPGLLWSVI